MVRAAWLGISLLLSSLVATNAAAEVPAEEAHPDEPTQLAQAEAERPRRRWPRRRWRPRRKPVRPPRAAPKPKPPESKPPEARPDEKIPWGVQVVRDDVEHFHVLFTADIFGRYAWPGCDKRPEGRADLSHFGAAVRKRSEEIVASGGKLITVSGGSMTRPDVLGPHVFAADPTLAWTAVDLIKAAGFDAVSVGIFDFNLPLTGRRHYMRLMNKAGIPLLAGNVRCSTPRMHPCANLGRGGKPYLVLQRGDLRIGLLAVVRDDLAHRMSAKARKGLQTEDSVETARRMIRALRQQEKVDFVVVIANLNVESDTPLPVVDFVRRLGSDDDPDLVVANSMFERDAEDFFSEIHQGHGSLIVGTDRFGQTLGEAVFYFRRDKDRRVKVERVAVHRHRTADATPSPSDDQKARRLIDGLCGVIDRPLGSSSTKGTLSYMGFMSYAMNIMRTSMRAEVALLNQRSAADTTFPMSGQLTKEMVLRTVRSDTHVGSFWATGARLIELLSPHMRGDTDLMIKGVERRGRAWYVNGRRLQVAAEYRVATTAFLAHGGGALLDLKESFADSGSSLRRLLLDFLSGPGPSYDGDPTVDPESDFPDLSRQWLFFSSADVALRLGDDTVYGGMAERRTRPDLLQDQSISFAVDARLQAGATSRNHQIDGFSRLQFRKMWKLTIRPVDCTVGPTAEKPPQCEGGDEHTYRMTRTPIEGLDRVHFDLTYRLLAARELAGRDQWYAPELYLESGLITELTMSRFFVNSNDDFESYRHGIVNSSIGVGISPMPVAFAKLGFAVRRELFTPPATGLPLTTAGLYLGWVLNKWRLLGGDFPLTVESRVDIYFTDFGRSWQHELISSTRIEFSLTRRIKLSVTDELLVYGRVGELAVAHNIALGLGISLDYRRQLF